MIVKLLLDQKRDGAELKAADIRGLIDAYVQGEVPDYQMAAFAMAVCCKGMTARETLALTEAMRDSGAVLDWGNLKYPTADKHSTGGVGDKLSFVIQPLAAACGVAVPSLTGRGLGLTGGTADKLESIPGYNAALSLDDFRKVVASCGVSLTVQTPEIAPADRKLYALRDVTGTVPSIALITASILSKKLAEGAGVLIFDVKCGCGAFMKNVEEARALAKSLVEGAKLAGRKALALVTEMDEPLGRKVGNALEIREALEVLSGKDVPHIAALSIPFAARMVALARDMPLEKAEALCHARLADGSAKACFTEMIRLHGGDLAAFEAAYRGAKVLEIKAPCAGYVARVDAMRVAEVAFNLGAGRAVQTDVIDPAAGVELMKVHGERVAQGDVIARLITDTRPNALPVEAERLAAAYTYSETPVPPRELIRDVIDL